MASRCRSFSRPALSFLSNAAKKPAAVLLLRPPAPIPRLGRGLGALQSLLPLHSAVASARLTSRLGVDSAAGSRSLSQESGLSVPR